MIQADSHEDITTIVNSSPQKIIKKTTGETEDDAQRAEWL